MRTILTHHLKRAGPDQKLYNYTWPEKLHTFPMHSTFYRGLMWCSLPGAIYGYWATVRASEYFIAIVFKEVDIVESLLCFNLETNAVSSLQDNNKNEQS